MRNKKYFFWMFGMVMSVLILVVNCGTTRIITVTNPPEWDMSGVKRIGIVSFAPGRYDKQIAKYLTDKTLEIILGTKRFIVISPEETQRLLNSSQSLSAQMDAVLTGSVDGYSAEDKTQRDDTTTTYTRQVDLTCTLRLERAADRSIINQKTEKTTTSSSANSRADLPSAVQLAQKMIDGVLRDLPRLIAPWNSEERLRFKDDKTKDPQMVEALKELNNGNTKLALKKWTEVYEKTQNIAAGYNAALATQVLGDLAGAIQLMYKVFDDTGNMDAKNEYERMLALARKQNIIAQEYSGNNANSTMDKAIAQAVEELKKVLTKNSTVAFFNISSKSKDVVNYSIDEISRQLINALGLNVIDRGNTQLIKNEQQYQMSGDVSDESAVSIGKVLGVNTMVVSSVTGEGTLRRLTFKVISVETSKILGLVPIKF
jgi:hypothetical protein